MSERTWWDYAGARNSTMYVRSSYALKLVRMNEKMAPRLDRGAHSTLRWDDVQDQTCINVPFLLDRHWKRRLYRMQRGDKQTTRIILEMRNELGTSHKGRRRSQSHIHRRTHAENDDHCHCHRQVCVGAFRISLSDHRKCGILIHLPIVSSSGVVIQRSSKIRDQ